MGMLWLTWGKRVIVLVVFFFFQAEDGIRDLYVTGVQTCALPISGIAAKARRSDRADAGLPRRLRPAVRRRGARRLTGARPSAEPHEPTQRRLRTSRSEERRVGKGGGTGGGADHVKKKKGRQCGGA